MKASPLAEVKEKYKDKAGLVKAVKGLATGDLWVDRVNEDKGLERVSNRKLLHIHQVLSEVKSRFGSRKGLLEAISDAAPHGKTKGYRESLEQQSTPRLLELHGATEKRAKIAAKKSSK